MPLYDFICKKCKTQFEHLCSFNDAQNSTKNKKVKCEKCGCTKVVKQVSFDFNTKADTLESALGHKLNQDQKLREAATIDAIKNGRNPNPYD